METKKIHAKHYSFQNTTGNKAPNYTNMQNETALNTTEVVFIKGVKVT